MKLALNLDSLIFVDPENPAAVARGVTMRRDDIIPLELLSFSSLTRAEIPDETTVSAQINLKETFGGSGLASDADFQKSGTGVDSVHLGTIDLTATAVDTAFTAAGGAAFIDAILEIKLDDGSHIQRSEPLAVRIQNSVSQAAE